MVNLATAKASNLAFSVTYRPTALFVGGTSGTGEGTAGAFARATKGNAHILLIGRNRESAERIIASFPQSSQSKYDFIECDVTLIRNCVEASKEVKSKIGDGPLNFLVVSQGVLTTDGFNPTKEGLDRKMSLHFYSRWKFVDELMPNLEKAVEQNQEARILSIMAAGHGTPLIEDDMGLKKNYSLARAGAQAPVYNELMVEAYAKRHPGMSFIHAFPGFVKSNLHRELHWSMQALLKPFALIQTSTEDCGEYMAYPLLNPAFKKGAFHMGSRGEPYPSSKTYVTDDAMEKLVEHYSKEVGFC